MTVKKRILICPLDWGLGHASRVSRIIKNLSVRGHEIIIAGSGQSLALLKIEFPGIQSLPLPSSEIRYNRKIPAWAMILLLFPGLLTNITTEHRKLKSIIREYKIDIIISDARYGLWNAEIPSILITHQLAIKLPVKNRPLERMIMRINRMAIKRFAACWVPDYQHVPNLSGELSHIPLMPNNATFIGPLSRFETPKQLRHPEPDYEIVAVISGPEPQRSVFEETVTEQLAVMPMKSLVICGRPGIMQSRKISDYCTSVSFLSGDDLSGVLYSARYIICRSGYSSIMDLAALKKTAFLVPTPGQTEQEYLADYLSLNNMFPSCRQDDFNLEHALSVLKTYTPQHPEQNQDILTDAIMELERMKNSSKST